MAGLGAQGDLLPHPVRAIGRNFGRPLALVAMTPPETQMKTPGADHPIAYTPVSGRFRARINDSIIADTDAAIEVREASYPPVVYFPRKDVETGYMSATSKLTHCPYKGDATHYTILVDSQINENSAWSYETPFPSAEAIQGYVSFYPKTVEVYSVSEDQLAARRID